MPMKLIQPIPVKLQFCNDAHTIYEATGPVCSTPSSAGVDLRACLIGMKSITIAPNERCAIPTGIAIEPLVPNCAGFVYSRSGLGAKTGLTVAQGVGVIDPDYRGEITVFLLNTSTTAHTVHQGDRIAQLIMQPYYQAQFIISSTLSHSERGDGGFGHTGNK